MKKQKYPFPDSAFLWLHNCHMDRWCVVCIINCLENVIHLIKFRLFGLCVLGFFYLFIFQLFQSISKLWKSFVQLCGISCQHWKNRQTHMYLVIHHWMSSLGNTTCVQWWIIDTFSQKYHFSVTQIRRKLTLFEFVVSVSAAHTLRRSVNRCFPPCFMTDINGHLNGLTGETMN